MYEVMRSVSACVPCQRDSSNSKSYGRNSMKLSESIAHIGESEVLKFRAASTPHLWSRPQWVCTTWAEQKGLILYAAMYAPNDWRTGAKFGVKTATFW